MFIKLTAVTDAADKNKDTSIEINPIHIAFICRAPDHTRLIITVPLNLYNAEHIVSKAYGYSPYNLVVRESGPDIEKLILSNCSAVGHLLYSKSE